MIAINLVTICHHERYYFITDYIPLDVAQSYFQADRKKLNMNTINSRATIKIQRYMGENSNMEH